MVAIYNHTLSGVITFVLFELSIWDIRYYVYQKKLCGTYRRGDGDKKIELQSQFEEHSKMKKTERKKKKEIVE